MKFEIQLIRVKWIVIKQTFIQEMHPHVINREHEKRGFVNGKLLKTNLLFWGSVQKLYDFLLKNFELFRNFLRKLQAKFIVNHGHFPSSMWIIFFRYNWINLSWICMWKIVICWINFFAHNKLHVLTCFPGISSA
jgi:hypothetical protein